MEAKLILSACAALALAAGGRAYADEGHKGATSAYEPAEDPQRAEPGTKVGGMDQSATGQAAASSGQTLTGTIDKVNEDKLTLRSDAGEKRELTLDSNTRLMREGKSISPSELQEGDEVRASLQGETQVTEISVIVIHPQQTEQGSTTRTPPNVVDDGPDLNAESGG